MPAADVAPLQRWCSPERSTLASNFRRSIATPESLSRSLSAVVAWPTFRCITPIHWLAGEEIRFDLDFRGAPPGFEPVQPADQKLIPNRPQRVSRSDLTWGFRRPPSPYSPSIAV